MHFDLDTVPIWKILWHHMIIWTRYKEAKHGSKKRLPWKILKAVSGDAQIFGEWPSV